MKRDNSVRVLKILLKDIAGRPTVSYLAKEIGLTRVGAWKLIRRMQSEKLILLSKIGTGKTSVYSAGLNWSNPLVEKRLALALTEDAVKNQRWLSNFAELEHKADFLVLYGSVIASPEEANDIDIIGVASDGKKFMEIEESLRKIQKTQMKKIHVINFTPAELRHELQKQNKAFIDALKKGVILFGQEKFIKFMKGAKSDVGRS